LAEENDALQFTQFKNEALKQHHISQNSHVDMFKDDTDSDAEMENDKSYAPAAPVSAEVDPIKQYQQQQYEKEQMILNQYLENDEVSEESYHFMREVPTNQVEALVEVERKAETVDAFTQMSQVNEVKTVLIEGVIIRKDRPITHKSNANV